MKPKSPLKIVCLQAENIKRLVAVEITPKGNVVQITGKNGQGKTSILDSIWWALAGTKNIQAEPIHEGASKGRIRLDMGELIVERTFSKPKGKDKVTTSLRVTGADGRDFNQPQSVLDSLLGALTFDPLAFSRGKPAEQFDALKRLVPGVDFDAIAEARQADFDRRTEIGRELKREQAAADAIAVPPNTPTTKVDEEALADELESALDHNAAIQNRKARRETAELTLTQGRTKIATMRDDLAQLEKEVAELEAKFAAAEPLPAAIDVEVLRARHREARENNAHVDAAARKREHQNKANHLQAQYDALTTRIEERDADKEAAIAEAKLPVDGLSFGDGEILLNGLPFEQASDAEQLRASIAIAMAMNPDLHVIRVRDGSLLDEDSMALVEEMASGRDFQIWVERVDSSGEVGFVVEDGHVREAGQ